MNYELRIKKIKNWFTTFSLHERGFTLVELLIVIVVIGVLAGGFIVFINPGAQFQKARDAQRKSDLSQIQKAIKTFYQDNGKYPDAKDNKIKSITIEDTAVGWGEAWLPYMGTLPKDPSSSKNYVYFASSDGQTYYIYASLDRGGNDSQACFSNGDSCSSAVSNGIGTKCGGTCNYGVSSPNVSP